MTTTYTITEALADLKTIRDRIGKKQQFIYSHAARPSPIVDPLAGDGGSEAVVARERQALGDLCARIVSIRTAIQAANLGNQLEVNGKTRSVAQWLSWRREVAKLEQETLIGITKKIDQTRAQTFSKDEKGQVVSQLAVAVSEMSLMEEVEALATTLGALDGKLSLFNATHTIEIQ